MSGLLIAVCRDLCPFTRVTNSHSQWTSLQDLLRVSKIDLPYTLPSYDIDSSWVVIEDVRENISFMSKSRHIDISKRYLLFIVLDGYKGRSVSPFRMMTPIKVIR